LSFRVASLRIECLIDLGEFSLADAEIRRFDAPAHSADEVTRIQLLSSYLLVRKGRPSDAIRAIAPVIRGSHGQGETVARAHWIAGVALYRAGHYRWSKGFLELSAAYYRLNRRKEMLAQVLVNLALVLKNQGSSGVALSALDEAMELVPQKGHWRTRLHGLLNRGICLTRIGQLESARVSLLKARTLAQSLSHDLVTIAVHNNLGHIYRMEGNYPTAREFYEEALRAARVAKAPRKEALALEFLAETAIEEGRSAEAVAMLDQAHAIAAELAGHGDLMMEILRRRGEAQLALGRKKQGIEDLRRAIDLCDARGEKRELVLTQRAYGMAISRSAAELAPQLQAVLVELQRLGDRFEFARTVCLLLEDRRLESEHYPWLAEAQATAIHYFTSMGLRFWKDRLQRIVGHAVRIPPAESLGGAARPDLQSHSAPYAGALEAARVAARSREPALIFGETGAGKEVFAKLVHSWSARAASPLVAINCGAIPENLIESELFGHARGAFTGADRDRAGLFESAAGGSVLLDEIGDLPAPVQVKLLRFLDSYELRRVGEHKVRRVDVRILAATHKHLAQLVQDGLFRQDLYFRLKVFRIDVPALRQRREDIPALVEHFLTEESQSSLPLGVAADLMRWFEAYHWPGNVRELRNLCRYLSARCWGKSEIAVQDLPPDLEAACREFLAGANLSIFEREKADLERTQILRALHQANGSISEASRLLRMGRNQVARKIRDYGLTREALRPD
jgi:DNA-binding NtrC family response regulator/tetratricopeptide (TPR) repeat protein